MKIIVTLVLTAGMLCAAPQAHAAPLPESAVPVPLKPWIGWALHGEEARRCPSVFLDAAQTLCTWPAELKLDLKSHGGVFTLQARLLAPGWLELPGDADFWPRNVRRDGAPAPVLSHHEVPALFLPEGSHRIAGEFSWSTLPESLRVPQALGLIALAVDGKPRAHPGRDQRQHLWLGQTVRATGEARHLSVKVYRLIADDIPLKLTTLIELEAAGDVREEILGPALPPGFIALSLDGGLPARLEADGRLRVQLRPGVWQLHFTARAPAPVSEIRLPAIAPPWPRQETWSLIAHPELRIAEPGGAPSVDPRQTAMPPSWHAYPAFLLDRGAALQLNEKQRGNSTPEQNQLVLQRDLWLDFNGGGYTLQDRLQGELKRGWRLETDARLTLGRVTLDGEPQFITRLEDGAAPGASAGVEVRQGALNLQADSRIGEAVRRLPASGWSTDLQRAALTLHLPPAWRLLAAAGADQPGDTWITRWTLLDLFVVLMVSIAALRLFGARVGALTLLTLALVWHEPGAPRWAWLNLIAAIALARALPASFHAGNLSGWINRYRWLSAAVLGLLALGFAVDQARLALYPQLEQYVALPPRDEERTPEEFAPAASPAANLDSSEVDLMSKRAGLAKEKTYDSRAYNRQPIQRMDPNVLTQTGPGLPRWRWHETRMSWSGPVAAEQTFRLWLSPPWLTRGWRVLSIALIALLWWRWLEMPGAPRWPRAASATPMLLALTLSLALAPQDARASDDAPPQIPSAPMLQQLRERLLAPAECFPACAQFSRMHIAVNEAGHVLLRVTADAQIETAVPLPVPVLAPGQQGAVWQPLDMRVDGQAASLRRGADGALWLLLPAGPHEVLMAGDARGFSQIELPLPLKPRQLSSALRGWILSGVNEQGQAGNAVLLSRAPTAAQAPGVDEAQPLPPLLAVTRTLRFGMDWEAETTVQRHHAAQTAVITTVPLLPGEAVTSDGVRVQEGAVLLSFAPGQLQTSWKSRLPVTPQLPLRAAAGTEAYETWRFDVSALWHVSFTGLAPISHQADGYWLPEYRPWPGEQLLLDIARPVGVPGQTMTLDHASLTLKPGARASDLVLDFRLRASQGGVHVIALAPGLSVQALAHNGQAQPVRQENEKVILTLTPGAQDFHLDLRDARGVSARLQSPLLDLGLAGVNATLQIAMPEDRWILMTGGPRIGPAVLFWGVLAVLLLVAFGLGQIKLTPLRARQWLLLMVGLSQIELWAAALVAGWLFALGLRGRLAENTARWRFNAAQLALVLLTLTALSLLFSAVSQGLLGAPDMQIAGNGSSAHELRWYQDRFDPTLPQASVLSVSLWFYRGLMLLWALWLANALLGWLRWGWGQYSSGGLWRKKPAVIAASASANPAGG